MRDYEATLLYLDPHNGDRIVKIAIIDEPNPLDTMVMRITAKDGVVEHEVLTTPIANWDATWIDAVCVYRAIEDLINPE